MNRTITKKQAIIAASFLAIAVIITVMVWPRTTVVKPRIAPVTEAVYAIGIVTSDYNYNLKPNISAVIEKFYFLEGQRVKKGDALMRTDTGVVFYSPYNGVISKRYAEQGEITVPGQPVLLIVDPERTHLSVTLDQPSEVKVRANQKCEISFENMRQKKYYGVIDRIYPSGNQFLAWITVSNLPPEVLVGMSADVAIQVERREKAVLVPAAAVNKGIISIRRGGKKMRLKINMGVIDSNWIEVLDGAIKPTDDIITPNK